jgi:hypothetical protein
MLSYTQTITPAGMQYLNLKLILKISKNTISQKLGNYTPAPRYEEGNLGDFSPPNFRKRFVSFFKDFFTRKRLVVKKYVCALRASIFCLITSMANYVLNSAFPIYLYV